MVLVVRHILRWGEASRKEKKRFIIDCAVAITIILIGVIALIIF